MTQTLADRVAVTRHAFRRHMRYKYDVAIIPMIPHAFRRHSACKSQPSNISQTFGMHFVDIQQAYH
eukprot:1592535-Amphidinium_carterae.1